MTQKTQLFICWILFHFIFLIITNTTKTVIYICILFVACFINVNAHEKEIVNHQQKYKLHCHIKKEDRKENNHNVQNT